MGISRHAGRSPYLRLNQASANTDSGCAVSVHRLGRHGSGEGDFRVAAGKLWQGVTCYSQARFHDAQAGSLQLFAPENLILHLPMQNLYLP